MISIGALTDAFLAHLDQQAILTGDGIAPQTGGWAAGYPNVAQFFAYTVLGMDGAGEVMPDYMVAQDWDVSWSLRHYGGSRKQCDFQADAARLAAMGMRSTVFGDTPYTPFKVINVKWRSLGSVNRIDQLDPPMWQCFDYAVLTCSKQ